MVSLLAAAATLAAARAPHEAGRVYVSVGAESESLAAAHVLDTADIDASARVLMLSGPRADCGILVGNDIDN